MKKMLLIAVALVFVAGVASAASIVNSAHDMRTHISNETTTQVCVFCHTPHMAAGRTQDPLWNHSLSTVATYGVYSSVTMNVVPTELAGSGQAGLLCLSCHDGTVAVNTLWKQPSDGNAGSTPVAGGVLLANMAINTSAGGYLGSDLTNDHPVNFSYNTSITGGDTHIRSTPSGSIVLFGGTVQCGSCHNVHDPQYAPFLRQSNAASAVCLACHDK